MQVTTQIVSVTGVPFKNGKPGLRFVVVLGTAQQPSTLKQEIANKAQALVGQLADVTLEQNGDFLNVINVESAAKVVSEPSEAPTPAIPIQAPQEFNRQTNPEDAKRMCRSASLATAFNFVGHLYSNSAPGELVEAQEAAYALAGDLYAQVMGEPQEGSQSLAEATPQAVLDQVQQVLGTSTPVQIGTEGVKSKVKW